MNSNTHAQYEDYAAKWLRSRAACEGQEAVHKQTTKFLPKFTEQKDADYASFLLRATYFNATGRTLEGLVGMVFRKDAVVNIPASLQPILDDMDLSGNSIHTLAMSVMLEVIRVGRVGALVEHPQVLEAVGTQAQAAQLNLRPYATLYHAESILDWRIQRVNNAMQPVMIKLMESYEVSEDIYSYKTKPQIRVLLLENGKYLQRIYRENEKKEWVQEGSDIIPLMNNQPLSFIPFWAFGAETNSLNLQNPPILDLADLNLAHYRVNALYERGCLFAAVPTPVLAGFQFADGESVAIGSTTCLTTPDPSAKWGFLEFTGQGLGELRINMQEKELKMAANGARMLEKQKAGVESEGAMQMRSNGENSVLASLANLVSENIEQILAFMADWSGIKTNDIAFELNTDYMPVAMSSQDIVARLQAYQAGALSAQELFEQFKRGEVISAGKSYDDHADELASAPPALSNA